MLKKINIIIISCLMLIACSVHAAPHSKHLIDIRSNLKKIFPNEKISVQYVGNTILLTGNITSLDVAQKTEKLVRALTHTHTKILNFMNLCTSQQVLLKVRIGQVVKSDSGGIFSNSADFDSLYSKGLIKLIAEPNLVSISGQSAEFVSGGEVPILNSKGEVSYKQYGVKLSFTPDVISPNLIRVQVSPEVSSLSKKLSGSDMPVILGHKTKTTVEMAPGESFMISGLVSDNSYGSSRELNEIVVSVTPFIVDPAHNSDISLPTDVSYVPNNMEVKFMDNVNSHSSINVGANESVGLEGPVGFVAE